ncbi:hypothetical protein LTR85_002293 [Meristemomyces frigidus]|nr:hypothetical protein LTR85_002293 [Meristemomyces frigidus]
MEPTLLVELDLPATSPLVHAADVVQADYDPTATVLHGKVTVLGSNTTFFFKPRTYLREPDFDREIRVLAALHAVPGVPRSPRFGGVVTSEHGKTVVGLLVQWIDGTKLADTGIEQRNMHLPRWQAQVKATLAVLHERGFTWGDANAWNVLVDRENKAWVIDFDGGARAADELEANATNTVLEMRAVDRLFEAIALLGPEESQYLGRFDG